MPRNADEAMAEATAAAQAGKRDLAFELISEARDSSGGRLPARLSREERRIRALLSGAPAGQ